MSLLRRDGATRVRSELRIETGDSGHRSYWVDLRADAEMTSLSLVDAATVAHDIPRLLAIADLVRRHDDRGTTS